MHTGEMISDRTADFSRESLKKTKSSTNCFTQDILYFDLSCPLQGAARPPSSSAQPPPRPQPPTPHLYSLRSIVVYCANTLQVSMLGKSRAGASDTAGPNLVTTAQLLGNRKPAARSRCREQLEPLCNNSLSQSTGFTMPRVGSQVHS